MNVNVFTRLGFVSKHKGSKLFSLRKRKRVFFGRNFNIFEYVCKSLLFSEGFVLNL